MQSAQNIWRQLKRDTTTERRGEALLRGEDHDKTFHTQTPNMWVIVTLPWKTRHLWINFPFIQTRLVIHFHSFTEEAAGNNHNLLLGGSERRAALCWVQG